jgi:hypothetical protein
LNYKFTNNGELESFTSPALSYDISYDKVGNITFVKQKDALGEQSVAFDYNSLYQLSKEKKEGLANEYSYDSPGKRLTKDGNSNQHDANNALLESNEESRVYDKAGNLNVLNSKEGPLAFNYDHLDRLSYLERKV